VAIRLLLTLCLILSITACKRRRPAAQETEEESPRLSSIVHVSDPRTSSQLISGWHDIEQNSWRWTSGKFSVMLRPPRRAAEDGAMLWLRFAIPAPVIAKLKAVALSATVNGAMPLPAESYTQSGDFVYTRAVPPRVLGGESVRIDFSLDKSLAATETDHRELGIVVTAVGLESK